MPGRAEDFRFPASQRKAKKKSLSVLCGSAVQITDPFMVNIKPPFLGVVIYLMIRAGHMLWKKWVLKANLGLTSCDSMI